LRGRERVGGFRVWEGERERAAREGGSAGAEVLVGRDGMRFGVGWGMGDGGMGRGEGEDGVIPLDLLGGGMLGDGMIR